MRRTLPLTLFLLAAPLSAQDTLTSSYAVGGIPVVHRRNTANDVVAVHQRDTFMAQAPGGPGAADLAAWVRRIDKIDRSWRD